MTERHQRVLAFFVGIIMGYCIGICILLLLSGCCLTGDGWHENVYAPVMSGARWDGWKQDKDETP